MVVNTLEPTVSVIVPVYNRADVIRRAVDSLLKQDFDEPYEIIVVDDGSTDGTADVVDDIDPLVRVVRQKNLGAAAARHTGIREACGEAVAFLDSDDVAEPQHLRSLWTTFRRHDEVVLAWGRVADMECRAFSIERQPSNIDKNGVLHDPLCAALETGCFTSSMNLMTSRRIALFCAEGRDHILAANDYDFMLRAATKGPFAFLDDRTIRCDRRDDGISRTRASMQAGYAVLAAYQAVSMSGRQDAQLLGLLGDRLRLLWPSAFVQLASTGHIALAAQVASVGIRTAGLASSLRPLWWAISAATPGPHGKISCR